MYWTCRDKKERVGNKDWKIEEYHKRIKQFCEVERCQARRDNMQRAYIVMTIRTFLREHFKDLK